MLSRNSYLANTIFNSIPGLMLATLAYLVMTWCAHTQMPTLPLEGSMGICLPSPNQWPLSPLQGIVLSIAGMALSVMLSTGLNARFSIIPGTGVLYATVFVLVIGSMPWLTQRLSSAILLLLVTLLCIHSLFSLYGLRNASGGIFIIFSTLAWGSMIQYAFVLMIPLFLLGAGFLGVLRLREFVAAVMGMIAPYWIMLGLGVVNPDELSMPTLTNLFSGFTDPGDIFFLVLSQGLCALFTLLLTAYNSLAYTAASRRQRSNMAYINLLSVAMVWYMVFDYTNMLAYSCVLALCLGWQCARYATIQKHRFAYLPVIFILPAFIAIFVLTLLS